MALVHVHMVLRYKQDGSVHDGGQGVQPIRAKQQRQKGGANIEIDAQETLPSDPFLTSSLILIVHLATELIKWMNPLMSTEPPHDQENF